MQEKVSFILKCEVRKDKSIPRVTVWHHKARQVVQSSHQNTEDIYLYLCITLMKSLITI